MWLHKKKVKDEVANTASNESRDVEKKSSFRKKFLNFGSRHTETKISNEDILRLEETKQRLFPSSPSREFAIFF